MLNHSLSVVLPVHNAEQTVSGKILELLDILPDLTPDFEILVVNDGSTDQTEEVAHELAITYPQVRVVRNRTRRGRQGAVEIGLQQTSGDILFVQDENARIDSSKLHRLWSLRDEEDLLLGASPRMRRSLLQRLAAWGVRLEEATQEGGTAGVQMIRRQALEAMNELDAIGMGESYSHRNGARSDMPASHESHTPKFRSVQRRRV